MAMMKLVGWLGGLASLGGLTLVATAVAGLVVMVASLVVMVVMGGSRS